MDNLRPKGTVERECAICNFRAWHDPLSPEATAIPYICDNCQKNPMIGFRCTACNRTAHKPHRDMVAEQGKYAHHCADCIAEGVPYRSFAKIVWCWSCADIAPSPAHRCPNIATHVVIAGPKDCDCPACWQYEYHSCDSHVKKIAKFFFAAEVRKFDGGFS